MGFEHLGFDAEERTWESLRKIHSSAPDFALKELRKLRLTRALKLASEYGISLWSHAISSWVCLVVKLVRLTPKQAFGGAVAKKRYQAVEFPCNRMLKLSSSSNGVFVGRVSRAYVQHFMMPGACYVPDAYDTRYVLYRYLFIRAWVVVRMTPTFRPTNNCIACGWWYA